MLPPGHEGYVICEQCLERNAPQDDQCHVCGQDLNVIRDEDDIFGIYGHAPDDDPLGIFASGEMDSDIVAVRERTGRLHCIQCDSPFSECGCGILYVSFDEALREAYEDGVDMYDPSSACDTCVFIFSSECEPLRGWLRMWTEDRESVEEHQLSGCEDYRSY